MRRVVITGMGLVSPLGNSLEEVLFSLKSGKSGITYQPGYEKLNLKSRLGGFTTIDARKHIDKKTLRFMGDAAAYAYIAMQQAIRDAELNESQVSSNRTGLIMGSGGTSAANVVQSTDLIRQKGARRLSPFLVPRTMSSTVSAGLTTPFQIRGVSYSISSACATGSHCIGAGMEQIQLNKQDIVFAGGSDEEHWIQTSMFDAMGALSANFNDTPERASRPYDVDRDGFVVANGAGVVVLEELDHARQRGARIYGEIVGYGATADGYQVVAPSGEGAVRCMQLALENVEGQIDYINAHGTSTPLGDLVELEAIREVFGSTVPPISSTKSLSGHTLGAAGVHEAIYCLLMIEHGFITASANIEHLDPKAADMPIITKLQEENLTTVMSNSYGFGGTNACLIFKKYNHS